ncbi:unnamed protein product [Symbiodinium sp. KB8]|nr:unnamed protein product [Symbiodinium sp. KB8]
MRVPVNLWALQMEPAADWVEFFYGSSPLGPQAMATLDLALVRPLVCAGGLCFWLWRYKEMDLKLATNSLFALALLAACSFLVDFFGLPNFAFLSVVAENEWAMAPADYAPYCAGWFWGTRGGFAWFTMSKLALLGWPLTGGLAFFGAMFWCFFQFLLQIGNVHSHLVTVGMWVLLGLLALMGAIPLFLEAWKKSRQVKGLSGKDQQMTKSTQRAVLSLLAAGVFLVVSLLPAACITTEWPSWGRPFEGHFWLMTIDHLVLLMATLVLGGVVDPEGSQHQDEALEELGFMGHNQGKRIAFPGRVNRRSKHCIVSFPGKYAAEWDAAVRKVKLQERAPSLACVFLTDKASGLGEHSGPPGQCWCRSLYGQMPASAYLSIVEDASSLSTEQLRFRQEDAKAMGQFLLVRDREDDEQWAVAKHNALREAEEQCQKNQGLAPWGCEWFSAWKKNVEEAMSLGQTLHVFYFENRVGQGKLSWQDLCDEAKIRQARENSGLGASQTAEVAYLDSIGADFVEHDVTDFYSFMEQHREATELHDLPTETE